MCRQHYWEGSNLMKWHCEAIGFEKMEYDFKIKHIK